jgi:hypothetical protein
MPPGRGSPARAAGTNVITRKHFRTSAGPEHVTSPGPGGAWSFTFSYAAAAANAFIWLTITKPLAATGYAISIIALLTVLVSWIAFRTVVLAVRGQLFPPWPPLHQAADTASPGTVGGK